MQRHRWNIAPCEGNRSSCYRLPTWIQRVQRHLSWPHVSRSHLFCCKTGTCFFSCRTGKNRSQGSCRTRHPQIEESRLPTSTYRCFACDRVIRRKEPLRADTRDDQWVYVGNECAKNVEQAGNAGWQPSRGGPRLYPMPIVSRPDGARSCPSGRRLKEITC